MTDLPARARSLVLTMDNATYSSNEDWREKTTALIRAALEAVVEAEREACARVADDRVEYWEKRRQWNEFGCAQGIAAEIRARGAR